MMILHFVGLLSRRTYVKIVRFVLVTFLVTLGTVVADEADVVQARPALWKVDNPNGGGGHNYLLGSFHVLPPNYHWFEGVLKKSFDGSDELILETEMTPEAVAQIQSTFIQNGFFTDGDSLKNHLDDAHYQKMLAYAAKLMGQNEAAAQKAKPWFMAIQLSIISIMSNGMDPNSGVDKFLEDQAHRAGKALSGLETPKEQMTALIDHPLHVQSAMLTDTLDKLDGFRAYMNSYLEAWASGDAEKIGETMVQDMAKYEDMYQALLVDRNKNWMPEIERRLANGKSTFIVVGAAHLVGKDGIVKLLRDKGYRVEKIQ